jgi:hypothetical protein
MSEPHIRAKGPSGMPDDPTKSTSSPKAPFQVAWPPDYKAYHCEAEIARNFIIPAALSRIFDDQRLSILGAASYLTTIFPDGQTPSDPVEKILLEQLTIAHHRSVALNLRAHQEADPDNLPIYNKACVQLGEVVRRMGLAIKQYRQPISSKSFAVIGQQNIATGTAGQQNVCVDQSTAENQAVSFSSRKQNDDAIGGRFSAQREESKTSGSRKGQRHEKAAEEV